MPEDHAWAIAWQEEQWLKCPGCSMPRDETWVYNPEHEREFRERFQAETRLCVSCDEIAKSRKRFDSMGKPAHAGGLFHVLKDARAESA